MLNTQIDTTTLNHYQRKSLTLLLQENLDWLGSYKTSNASLVALEKLGLAKWVQEKGTREQDKLGHWELAKTREAEIQATRSAATLFYVGSVKAIKTMVELKEIRDPRIYKIKPASIQCLHRYGMIAPIKNSKGWKITELGTDAGEYLIYLDSLPNTKGSEGSEEVSGNSAD